jgi:hypothetical protein
MVGHGRRFAATRRAACIFSIASVRLGATILDRRFAETEVVIMTDDARSHHTVPITIDGRPFEVEPGRHETAGDLLRLAGLDPNGYDLAVIREHGEIHKFADNQRVDVQPHEKFVSIRQTAPVA